MHEMAKNRQRADDSNWMPKVAPWREAILAKLAKFGKNGEYGTNGEKLQKACRYPECGKYSNWIPKVAPLDYITKEVPVRQHLSNTTRSTPDQIYQNTPLLNCEATFIKYN